MPALPFSKLRQAGCGALDLYFPCGCPHTPGEPGMLLTHESESMALHRPALNSEIEAVYMRADAQCLRKLRRTWILRKRHHFHLSLHKHLCKDMDSFWNRLFWLMAEFQAVILDLNLLGDEKDNENNRMHTVKQLFGNTAGMVVFTANAPLAGPGPHHLYTSTQAAL